MFDEKIFTIEELSQHLRVPADAIRKEIDSGRLRANDIAGHIRVRESTLNRYMDETQTPRAADPATSATAIQNATRLSPAPDLEFVWPDGKHEQFTEVSEGVAAYEGKQHHVKIGFTVRKSAGKSRRRSLVQVDRYATVEFVASGLTKDGKMAAIIKGGDGKQIPLGGTVPPEYQGLSTGAYRDIVEGPGAPNGLAVVCQADDLETMIKHALIRYRYREIRADAKRSAK